MQVQVLYFAAAREAAGTEAETVALPAETTVEALMERLAERHVGLAALRPGLRCAVGERFADAGRALRDGEVVALLPPVSGG